MKTFQTASELIFSETQRYKKESARLLYLALFSAVVTVRYLPFGCVSMLLLIPVLFWGVSPAWLTSSESLRRYALYLLSRVHFATGILVGSSDKKKVLSGRP